MTNPYVLLDILLSQLLFCCQLLYGVSVEENMVEVVFIELSTVSENWNYIGYGLAYAFIKTWNIGEIL